MEGGKKKGKLILLVLGLIGSVLLLIIPIALIGSGVIAVVQMAEDMAEQVGEFFSEDDLYNQLTDESLSDDDLEKWMINRNDMIYLLEKVQEFNERELKNISVNIETTRTWREYEPSPTPLPTSTPTPTATPVPTATPAPTRNPKNTPTSTPKPTATPTPTPTPSPTPTPTPFVPKIYDKTDKVYLPMNISEEQSVVDQYKIYWQLIYMFCTYRFVDNGGTKGTDAVLDANGKVFVGEVQIDWMVEALTPTFTYVFDPTQVWKENQYVSESDVLRNRYVARKWDMRSSNELIVDSTIYYRASIPRFKLEKVEFAFGTDYYTYTWRYDPNEKREVETVSVRREYDTEKFMRILELYAGTRDVRLFTLALGMIPGAEGIAKELSDAFGGGW